MPRTLQPPDDDEQQIAVAPVGDTNAVRLFLVTRAPQVGLTLTMLVGVAILLALGTWQVARLGQKNRILHDVRAQLAAPARDLRHAIPIGDTWRTLEHQPVRVQGTWQVVHRLKLAPRTLDGQVGYQMVVPLQLDNGQVLLVDRGFAPDNAAILPDPPGIVTVSGVVRLPETTKASRFTPDNDPVRGQWVWVDLPAMGRAIGVANMAPVMLYEDRISDRDTYPIGGQIPLPLNNRHRQYAVTWYLLALGFIAVWLIASAPVLPPVDVVQADDDDTLA